MTKKSISEVFPDCVVFIEKLVNGYMVDDGKFKWSEICPKDIFHFKKLLESEPDNLKDALNKHDTSLAKCDYFHEEKDLIVGICKICGAEIENPRFERFPYNCSSCNRAAIWECAETLFEGGNGKPIPLRVANEILRQYKIITSSPEEDIYCYNEGVYYRDGEVLIKEKVQEILGDDTTKYIKNEVISCIKGATYTQTNKITFPHLINLRNGLFNTEKMCMENHAHEVFSLTQLPIDYDPYSKCPKILTFLDEILRPEDVLVMQELFGYCLHAGYNIQKAFMLVGDGANGKSTLLALMKAFLGPDNIISIDLHNLMSNRFSLAQLNGKLANIYPDISHRLITNTGIFKALTGGDTQTADRKFREPIQFVNQAKLIFSTNRIPDVEDESNAYCRRWIIIDFPNKFEGDKCDLNIIKELTTDEELSGLFNWALKGRQRLLDNGCFSNCGTTEEIRNKYKRMASSIACYMEDMIEVSPDDWIPKDELYSSYTEYCRKQKLPILAKNVFSKDIHKHINIREERRTIEGRRVQGWTGLRILSGMSEVSRLSSTLDVQTDIYSCSNKIEKNPDTSTTLDQQQKIELIYNKVKEYDDGKGAVADAVYEDVKSVFHNRANFEEYIEKMLEIGSLTELRDKKLVISR